MSNEISKRWHIKYKIRSEEISCAIGYALKDGIQDYDHALGRFENKATSIGIQIDTEYDYYSLFDLQHQGTG